MKPIYSKLGIAIGCLGFCITVAHAAPDAEKMPAAAAKASNDGAPWPVLEKSKVKRLVLPGRTFQGEAPNGGFWPDPPGEQGVCPPSGYAPTAYGYFGDNVEGITEPYELASPCNSQEVRDVASALGLGRYAPIGLKNLVTIVFTVKGSLAAPLGMGANSVAKIEMNFMTDSVRIDVIDGKDKKKRAIHVVSDGQAWEEATPGTGYSAAPDGAAALLAPLVKLTPFGAFYSIIEAEGHATMEKAGDKMTFTGTSPYDNWPVTVTTGFKNLPEKMEMKANGHVYTATFLKYEDDWEPAYYYVFPSHMVWTMDGKPLADLIVTGYKSDPYAVFPPPSVKAAAN
jgi:hypothetical protein